MYLANRNFFQLLSYVPGADKGKKIECIATLSRKQGAKVPTSSVKDKETPLGSKQTPDSKVSSLLSFLPL